MARGIQVTSLLAAATTTETGGSKQLSTAKKVLHCFGTTTAGAGAATVLIEVSSDGTENSWILLATMTLTLATTKSSEGFVSDAPWAYMRARVSAISGTGAAVSVNSQQEAV